MISSISQTAILFVFQILSLVLACSVARDPRKAAAGISLGVLIGVALLLLSTGVVGFVGHTLPLGQMDFWLASLFHTGS